MKILKKIIRYPIKGLSGEILKEIKVHSGCTITYDRKYALARFDTEIDELHPEYLKKTNFLALVKDEKLALLKIRLDHKDKNLKLYYDNQLICFNSINEMQNYISNKILEKCSSLLQNIKYSNNPYNI